MAQTVQNTAMSKLRFYSDVLLPIEQTPLGK